MYHVNVLENVINRQDKNNRRRTVSTFIEKGDKPELKKVLFFFGNGEKFCLPMIQNGNSERCRLDFQGNLVKFHCNPKEFQREVVGVVLMREEKAFSEGKKEFYKSHQIVLL